MGQTPHATNWMVSPADGGRRQAATDRRACCWATCVFHCACPPAADATKAVACTCFSYAPADARPVAVWKCQAATAATQASFVVGSVLLKSALRYVDEDRGEAFSPIVYALAREACAGPILLLLAWAMAGAWQAAGRRRADGAYCLCSRRQSVLLLQLASLACRAAAELRCLPELPAGLPASGTAAPNDNPLPALNLRPPRPAGSVRPKRADAWRVGVMGAAMFLSQLLYILGIELSGVAVATCMQPAIPVRRCGCSRAG